MEGIFVSKRPGDFRSKTINTLGRRCGFICSNPACTCLTVGGHSDPNKSCTIGIASHIEAASKRGPRYNPNMTVEERRSIENGIWLCSICAHTVDTDPEVYTVELLKRWKKQAESKISLGNNTLEKIICNKVKVIAVTNLAGGVAKSFASAALAYCLVKITKKKVLCISCAELDNAPMALGIGYDVIKKVNEEKNTYNITRALDIFSSPAKVDIVCRYSLENNKMWQEQNYGVSSFNRVLEYLLEIDEYGFIVCDCGRGDASIQQDIILNATDVVIPIGENSNSYRGMSFIAYALRKNKVEKKIWVLNSMGLLANLHSKLYEDFLKAKELILKINCIKVKDFSTIVPYNSEVDHILSKSGNLFEFEQISDVMDAYMKVVDELISER